jgi:ribosome recycling factor
MFFNEEALKTELEKIITYFQNELKELRTGRADVDAINSVQVEAYGTMNALNTVGQVSVINAIDVKISVWDKGVIQNVEKSLR